MRRKLRRQRVRVTRVRKLADLEHFDVEDWMVGAGSNPLPAS